MTFWTEERKNETRQRLCQLPPEQLRQIMDNPNEDCVVRIMAQTVLLAHDPGPLRVSLRTDR